MTRTFLKTLAVISLALSLSLARAAVIYDNGPVSNSSGTGIDCMDESVLESITLGMNTIGFGHQVFYGNRIADDFVVTQEGWRIDTITFYAYQTGSTTASTITGVNLRIWDGPPGAMGSVVVYGDTSTNRLESTGWSDIYRVTESTTGVSADRPIMANVVRVDTVLAPGTYWLDWQTDGTLGSGPWAPPIAILSQAVTGNGLQSISDNGITWGPALDSGIGAPQQGFPFVIEGEIFEPPPAKPSLIIDPSQLTFTVNEDNPTTSQTVNFSSVDGGVTYRLRPGSSWMTASPTQGRVNGGPQQVNIMIDATDITPGTYDRPMFVNSSDGGHQIEVRLTVTPGAPKPPPVPAISSGGVVSAASFASAGKPGHASAPGSVIAIFGTNFTRGNHFEARSLPLPTNLGGVTVDFNGVPASLFSVWPNQINAALPWGVTGANIQAVVTNSMGSSLAQTVQTSPYSPAIYTVDASGKGQGVVLFANTTDFAASRPAGGEAALKATAEVVANRDPARETARASFASIVAAPSRANQPNGESGDHPAKEGDLLMLFGNGLGPVTPIVLDGHNSCDPGGVCAPDGSNVVLRETVAKPEIIVGGVTVPASGVIFSGLAPQFVGLNQVHFYLPPGVPNGPEVPISIRIGGVESPAGVTIAVE